jgi:hypothetical protein
MDWIIIKSKDRQICKTSINIEEEDSMGVINGQFIPFDGYESIRQLIKEYSRLIVELSIEETQKNSNLLKLRKEIKELCLTAYNDKNEKLDFSHIDLRDFSDELGSEGFSVLLYR